MCGDRNSILGLRTHINKLSEALKPVSEELDADAAVGLLLRIIDEDIQVLFVRRVENRADPWSGQMALPGGKRHVKDKNLNQTVIRETLEETNINLLNSSRFLGVMEALRSSRRLQMRILPFVVLLEHDQPAKLNEKELAGFVWISLQELIKHKATTKFSFGNFPAYIVENNVIWGLTYQIIEKLVQALESR